MKRPWLATDLRKILARLRVSLPKAATIQFPKRDFRFANCGLAQSQITLRICSFARHSLARKLLRIPATIHGRFKGTK